MKWLIVVLFATIEGDIYVFENPSFETEQACREFIMDRQQIPNLTQKLLEEYGKFMPIQAVNCLEEEHLNNILSGLLETKV
tara:strand:- start:121 stop:363 length:243 start_codon:yes stop_codon:yes gene_type:complete